ncbi:MAG TPA: hypothetical protein VD758_11830, partial [Gemmatimonadaceae bacterium]|nr:hypothetical protein [Gemmatimonadaceae bacterium]
MSIDGRTTAATSPEPRDEAGERILDAFRRWGYLQAALDPLGWVQEEPANMGARAFVMPRLRRLLDGRPLRSVRRSASASPATGSAKAHDIEQHTLLAMAFG